MDGKWRPSSVLRDALQQSQDDAVVERFAATPMQAVDLEPLRRFVRQVRADIGPEGEILSAKMAGDACEVVFRRTGGRVETQGLGTAPQLADRLDRRFAMPGGRAVVPPVPLSQPLDRPRQVRSSRVSSGFPHTAAAEP